MYKLIIFICLFSYTATSQSTVDLKIQLLTSDVIGNVTLEKEPYIAWVKEINEEVTRQLKLEKGDKEVLIILTVHNSKSPTIEIGAKPKLEKSSYDDLLKSISKLKAPNTKYADYSLAISVNVNEGCKKEMDFYPLISSPFDREYANYKALKINDKKIAFQDWINSDILPILAHYETNVDPQYKGVLSIGEMVKQKKFLDSKIEDLTDKNPNYWRAVMEMEVGNQLIPFTKVCMHISKGEFDKAKRLLVLISYFSDDATLPKILHEEIAYKMDLLSEDLSVEINKGIALHDQQKYAKAITHYESLLKTFPNSAWLNYELYLSTSGYNLDDLDKGKKEWDEWKKIIYACDPLYPISARANSGLDGYQMFKRQEIPTLFKTKANLKTDFVKLADIALDLGDYAFAAQTYWLIVSNFKTDIYNDRNIIAHFLYCLDKLEDQENIKNFKDDYVAEFEKIETERREIMENDTMYKAFQKKD